jgi:hypothetical protein
VKPIVATKISLLLSFFAAGQAGNKERYKAQRRFRFDDQSRIAGVCREIRRLAF